MTKGNVNVLVITILRTTGSYGGGPIKNLVLLTEYARVLGTNVRVSFITVPHAGDNAGYRVGRRSQKELKYSL